MRKCTITLGPSPKLFKSKVEIARSIIYLRHDLLYQAFKDTGLLVHKGKRELEALRASWLDWLDRTPRDAFLSYHDARTQYLADVSADHFEPHHAEFETRI